MQNFMCLYDLTGVEPRLNSIIFIDAMGNESNRLMNQIQKKLEVCTTDYTLWHAIPVA